MFNPPPIATFPVKVGLSIGAFVSIAALRAETSEAIALSRSATSESIFESRTPCG